MTGALVFGWMTGMEDEVKVKGKGNCRAGEEEDIEVGDEGKLGKGVRKGICKRLSDEEEGLVMEGVRKSLPVRACGEYAGVEWVRMERLMRMDSGLRKRVARAMAVEQGKVMELLKMKGGDVKALAFMLERVYGMSAIEAKAVKKEKEGVGSGLTITPAVLKALAGGVEMRVERN